MAPTTRPRRFVRGFEDEFIYRILPAAEQLLGFDSTAERFYIKERLTLPRSPVENVSIW